ncbi:unnamed protein product [Polarella glacialis]|uniref:EF-hand domain-containing protein n=1 Tax=Polarella glacialis TaxID=89957 RepID=A0A813DWQ6_POLGL|nr:unnamed protein product [Polarella glacialis]
MADHGDHHNIGWAKKMIKNDKARREFCDREFAACDDDGNGTLEVPEVVTLVFKICESMSIKLPQKEKVAQLVALCGKSKPGHLQSGEFRSALKAVLKSCLHEAEVEDASERARQVETPQASPESALRPDPEQPAEQVEMPQPKKQVEQVELPHPKKQVEQVELPQPDEQVEPEPLPEEELKPEVQVMEVAPAAPWQPTLLREQPQPATYERPDISMPRQPVASLSQTTLYSSPELKQPVASASPGVLYSSPSMVVTPGLHSSPSMVLPQYSNSSFYGPTTGLDHSSIWLKAGQTMPEGWVVATPPTGSAATPQLQSATAVKKNSTKQKSRLSCC